MNKEGFSEEITPEPVEENSEVQEITPEEEIQEQSPNSQPDNTPGDNVTDLQEPVEDVVTEETPQEEVESLKPTSKKQLKPVKYEMKNQFKRSEPASRKMAYLILFETIFILVLMGLNGYLLYNTYNLRQKTAKNTKNADTWKGNLEELQRQLDEVNQKKIDADSVAERIKQDIQVITSNLEAANTEKQGYKDELDKLKPELETLTQAKDDAERQLKDVQQKVGPLERTNKDLRDGISKAEKDIQELNQRIVSLQEDYDKLKIEKDISERTARAKQAEFEKQYAQYAPLALEMVKGLQAFHESLATGIELVKFVRKFDNIKTVLEEFRMNAGKYSQFISFQLIVLAIDAYQESEEKWTKLSQLNLPREHSGFKDKMLKFEQPIQEYRPWVDMIQIYWQKASFYVKAAEKLIQNKEDFDTDKCSVCEGKHFIVCPKCAGGGECFSCNGKGIDEKKDNAICLSCEGSGRCSFCNGKKEIPCPVCVLSIKFAPKK